MPWRNWVIQPVVKSDNAVRSWLEISGRNSRCLYFKRGSAIGPEADTKCTESYSRNRDVQRTTATAKNRKFSARSTRDLPHSLVVESIIAAQQDITRIPDE